MQNIMKLKTIKEILESLKVITTTINQIMTATKEIQKNRLKKMKAIKIEKNKQQCKSNVWKC